MVIWIFPDALIVFETYSDARNKMPPSQTEKQLWWVATPKIFVSGAANPHLRLLLAKISLCRYTNIASLIRYLHARVALTVKKNIAAFSTALWLSVTAAALAGTP